MQTGFYCFCFINMKCNCFTLTNWYVLNWRYIFEYCYTLLRVPYDKDWVCYSYLLHPYNKSIVILNTVVRKLFLRESKCQHWFPWVRTIYHSQQKKEWKLGNDVIKKKRVCTKYVYASNSHSVDIIILLCSLVHKKMNTYSHVSMTYIITIKNINQPRILGRSYNWLDFQDIVWILYFTPR